MSLARLTGVVALCAALTTGGVAAAEPAEPATVTEVRATQGGQPSILVDIGERTDVHPGQSVEVRRGKRTIGYGSVDQVFGKSRIAVATIGTVVGGVTLEAGDQVVFRGQGFHRPVRASGSLPARPAEPKPTPEPARQEPPRPTAIPVGKVVSVHEGLVLISLGPDKKVSIGDRISLRDDAGREVARIAVELLGARRAGGPVLEGAPRVGTHAVSLGQPEKREIDFVALDFLGVVADIEYAGPRQPGHLGVPVWRVVPGSPADRGGIGRGDRVVAVEGYVVSTPTEIRERVERRSGSRVRVVVVRAGRLVDVDVSFGD